MAIFLLIYIIFVLIYAAWAGVLIYHAEKYKLPKDNTQIFVTTFIALSAFLLIISIIFLAGADWTTVPKVLGGKG